tara:strand:+ start:276 stop:854 length:579 start_codon:yes stop_codon:yes gene_type:complete
MWQGLELTTAKSTAEKELVKSLISQHHSYVKSSVSVGRRIDWLVYLEGLAVGMIGIGSATYPPSKDILNYLELDKKGYREIFNKIANNWRFCLVISKPNLGTQVLKRLRSQAVVEWQNKYGDSLLWLMTFVGGGNNGAVYKADNWTLVGQTAGLPTHKSSSMKWHNKEQLSQLFVKPTGENKKLIFVKRLGQ